MWIVGGPQEKEISRRSCRATDAHPRPHRTRLRSAILAIAAAGGRAFQRHRLRVAAAGRRRSNFGHQSLALGSLNRISAVIERRASSLDRARPGLSSGHHRCMRDIEPRASRLRSAAIGKADQGSHHFGNARREPCADNWRLARALPVR